MEPAVVGRRRRRRGRLRGRAAVGDWWASSSIWDKLDMAMTVLGFIPGLDIIPDAD